VSRVTSFFSRFLERHPVLKSFVGKIMKDNLGLLAPVVSWTLITSVVPITVGLVAISSLFLHSPSAQASVIDHLAAALQGAFTRQEIQDTVHVAVRHNGLLGIIGFIGILWGGSAVGGAISTVFQPIFRVGGRPFVREKLIDVSMILLLTALLIVVVFSTTAIAYLDKLVAGRFPPVTAVLIATGASLLAAYTLFASIYLVFPNVRQRFKLRHVWTGALVAAVLFQGLTCIFPIYTSLAHLQEYGAVLGAMLVLTAWIYLFSMILLIGAEIVAFSALRAARGEHERIGPAPDGTVPQHAERLSG
jgi:membrane protein